MIESEKYCKPCRKSLCQGKDYNKKGCSDCYLISSGWAESALTKLLISFIYLPWWHNKFRCDACYSKLKFTSDCQKNCENCLIFYTGCRFCLTTNIIFGLTNQSQCKKCKRTTIIPDITNISSGNSYLDNFLVNIRINLLKNS